MPRIGGLQLLDMDPQEVKTGLLSDRCEGSVPTGDESKSHPAEDVSVAVSPNSSKKSKGSKGDKKTDSKTGKKSKKVKSSKSKKASRVEESSSASSEDETTFSSSYELTESEAESEAEENLKKKQSQRKRQDPRKSKKKPSKSSKTTRKSGMPKARDTEVDSSDSNIATDGSSDFDDEDVGGGDDRKKSSKASLEQELTQVRLQMQQMQRQIAAFGLSGGQSGLNASGFNQSPLGAGGLTSTGGLHHYANLGGNLGNLYSDPLGSKYKSFRVGRGKLPESPYNPILS